MQGAQDPKRVNGIAVIRAVSFVFIVLQHVIGGVWQLPDKGASHLGPIAFLLLASRFAVPAFLMCAGYLAVGSSRKTTLRGFWARRIRTVVLPYALWGCFYWFWNAMRFGSQGASQGTMLWNGLLGLMRGTHSYHLWFMATLIALYLLLPILIRLMDRVRGASWAVLALSIALAVFWAEGGNPWFQSHAGDWAGGNLYFYVNLTAPWLMYATIGVQAARLGFLSTAPSGRWLSVVPAAAVLLFGAAIPGQLELLARAAGDYGTATWYFTPYEIRAVPFFCVTTAALGLLASRAPASLMEKFVRLDALSFFGFLAHPLALSLAYEWLVPLTTWSTPVILALVFTVTLASTLWLGSLAARAKLTVGEALGAR